MSPRKKIRTQDGYGCFIPEDIISCILSRLPTPAAIFRFRCISKSWNRILSNNPKAIHRALWIQSHQQTPQLQQQQVEESQVILIRHLEVQEQGTFSSCIPYSLLSYDTLLPITTSSKSGVLQYRNIPVNLGRKPVWQSTGSYIVGCCDGMFCILRSPSPEVAELVLWNPFTSETMVLPNSQFDAAFFTDDSCEWGMGFGFDSGTGDYKVVQILYCRRYATMSSRIRVYSLRNCSWKEVKISQAEGRAIRNCRFHNVVRTRGSSCEIVYWHNHFDLDIASFDFRDEKFTMQVAPAGLAKRVGRYRRFYLAATPLKDSLVAVFRDSNDKFEVWGLLRYQNVGSWTKLFTSNMRQILSSSIRINSLVGFSGNGEYVLLRDNGELLSFDFESEQVKSSNGIRILEEDHHHFSWLEKGRDFFDGNPTYSYVPSRLPITSIIGSDVNV